MIAQAAIQPRILIPGIEHVSRYTGGWNSRYANAIFTPGQIFFAAELLQENIISKVPQGSPFKIFAVLLNAEEMIKATQRGYRRDGYACLWVTGDSRPDGAYWLGDFRAGAIRKEMEIRASMDRDALVRDNLV